MKEFLYLFLFVFLPFFSFAQKPSVSEYELGSLYEENEEIDSNTFIFDTTLEKLEGECTLFLTPQSFTIYEITFTAKDVSSDEAKRFLGYIEQKYKVKLNAKSLESIHSITKKGVEYRIEVKKTGNTYALLVHLLDLDAKNLNQVETNEIDDSEF